jgi:hypothetical protein
MSAAAPDPPNDGALMTELRQLAIQIQRHPDQKRKIVLDWYERTLQIGAQNAEMGMLLLTILTAQEDNVEKITVQAVAEKPLVISVHGIRTRGDWQKQLASVLSRANFVYEPLDYGFFRAIQLVVPFMRDAKTKWFLEKYTAITKDYRNPPCIIAHSFGTYLVARTLLKYVEVKFDRIIFCGSIVAVGYPWSSIMNERRAGRVLNDYGGKDFWAKTAVWFVNDAGPSGARGFQDNAEGRVTNRYRPEFRHSDFFYAANFANTWLPFLEGTDPGPVTSINRQPTNWKFRIVLVVLVLLASVLLFGGYRRLRQVKPKLYVAPQTIALPPAETPVWRRTNQAGIEYSYDHVYPMDNNILIRTQRSCSGSTPCDDWDISWNAPGPVYEVRCEVTFSNEGVEIQAPEGNIAHCHGWINGSNGAIKMHAKYMERW